MNSAFYAFAYTGFGVPLLLSWLGSELALLPVLWAFTAVPVLLAAWLRHELAGRPRR
jgi:hypothetical protein